MGLNPGQMDREIVIQTATKTQDAMSGEEVIDWTTVTETVWARWLPAGSKEAWQAQQRLTSYIDGVFHIYYLLPRPTPAGSRIVFDGKVYDVKGVIEMGRAEGLEIPVVAHGDG